MDSVIPIFKTSYNTYTNLYGVETQKVVNKYKEVQYKTIKKWYKNVSGGAIYYSPTLANIDGDTQKEIITGTRNGTIYAYDIDDKGRISEKWRYVTEPRLIPSVGDNSTSFNGGSAVADIDLDGDNEVIFSDVIDLKATWPAKLYVLHGSNGSNMTSRIIGSGGAYASISIANLDSDDNPEIVVPTQFGIMILDYSPSTKKLTQVCNNTHALITGSAVISDLDLDGDYEVAYVTNSINCDLGKTCENKLHVINPSTCNDVTNFPITFTDKPRPTAGVANLDSDSNLEIIVSLEQTAQGLGSIKAIDGVTGSTQWTYNDNGRLQPGFVAPHIADIDNNGYLDIIIAQSNGSTIHIIRNNGTILYKFNISGFIDNGLAIADSDNDQMAEIVFKRSGSPTQFTSVSNQNYPPEVKGLSNITAIAGELININSSGAVALSDLEGDNSNLYYSSPFNSSGEWKSTTNDTGNYSVLVEASDGTLSTLQNVEVILFNSSTKLVNTFSDNSNQKILNFSQAGNLSVKVRIPKNASIAYSKMNIQGATR